VEEYIKEKAGAMIWNSVRIAGYFNNFLTFWKPKKLDDGTYVLDLAMEGKPMYGMDVEDFGECVASKIIVITFMIMVVAMVMIVAVVMVLMMVVVMVVIMMVVVTVIMAVCDGGDRRCGDD
jgi:type IV secretory pathway VirB6-like protein